MRLIPFALLVLGAACDSPSPWMARATATPVEVAGFRMTLWRADDQVELIRHGYASRAEQAGLRTIMAQVLVEETGCALRPGTLEGDTGVLRARLAC